MRTALRAAACVVLLAAGVWAAEAVQAVVTAVKGTVTIERQGKPGVPAKPGDFLYPGDVLLTGPASLASVALTGGAEVRINAKSKFEFKSQAATQKVKLEVGQVWSRMLTRRAGLQVQTPTAVAAVRGTEADIRQEDDMTVKVYEGHVDVINPFGKVSLTEGQMSRVSGPNAAPEPPRQMTGEDKESWQDGIKPDDRQTQEMLEKLDEKAGRKTLKLTVEEDGEEKTLRIDFEKK